MKKLLKNKKGFTLIELIVVIAILGILAAIAVPRLIGFQDRAKQQADNQVAAQVKNALGLLYANGEINIGTAATGGTANFNVDTPDSTSIGNAVVTGIEANELEKRDGTTDITNADMELLIEQLISDIRLQSTRSIDCTVTSQGAISAILN